MSLFGQLDAANIPSSPYFIEAGDYSAELSKAFIKEKADGSRQLIIEYTITDEDSEFYDKKASKYYNLVDPKLSPEDFKLMPADEKKKILGALSSLKRDMCGMEGNSKAPGLGVDVDTLNSPDWNPESLMGIRVHLSISNYGPTNEGVNVKWANITDEVSVG